MKRIILMKKYEKVNHGCCEDCVAEFKTKLCAKELCLYLNDDNPCMGHWEFRGEPTKAEIVEGAIEFVRKVLSVGSCAALYSAGASDELVEAYQEHSGARTVCSGFAGHPDFLLLSLEERKAVRIEKLTAFLESLK